MSNRRCNACGRFIRCVAPATWAEIYDFVSMGLDREVYRCGDCSTRLGSAVSNARPWNGDMSPYQGTFQPARQQGAAE